MNQKTHQLNGFFQALEIINARANEGYSFYIDELKSCQTLEIAVEENLKQGYPNDPITFEYVNWKSALTEILKKWLIINPTHYYSHQKNSKEQPTNHHNENELIEHVLKEIDEAIDIEHALIVKLQPSTWYEISWSDIAFQGRNGMYLLHFGLSD